MNYNSLKSLLLDSLEQDGYDTYFGVSLSYPEFETNMSLKPNSICISYNGVESLVQNEMSYTGVINEPITVFIKCGNNFDTIRKTALKLIQSTNNDFTLMSKPLVMEFTGGALETFSTDTLIYTLNFNLGSQL